MGEILEKAISVRYGVWINVTGVPFFACYIAGCCFIAVSHMQLYLRVKFFPYHPKMIHFISFRETLKINFSVVLCSRRLDMYL